MIPVTNEDPYARGGLENPHVRWAAPTPHGLADALSAIVDGERATPQVVAASVRSRPWDDAQRTTVATIEDEVYGPAA